MRQQVGGKLKCVLQMEGIAVQIMMNFREVFICDKPRATNEPEKKLREKIGISTELMGSMGMFSGRGIEKAKPKNSLQTCWSRQTGEEKTQK